MKLLQQTCLWLLLCVFFGTFTTEAWFFSSRPDRSRSLPHDVRTQSGLTRLYNQPVVSATRVERPLGSLPAGWMAGPLRHEGVVVRTANGGRWLVHKGAGFGRSSETVVTDARHMSDRWRPVDSRPVRGSRVADYVRAGGANYHLLCNNCQHGAGRMMEQP